MSSLLAAEVRTVATIFAKVILPVGSVDYLRGLARARRKSQRNQATPPQGRATATRDDLAVDLRSLGLKPGQDVLVHSALSTLGPVEDGPAGVVDAIRAVSGRDATLLAPAYPMSGTMYAWMTTDGTFDVRNNRSRMGAISEYMRGLPGARRSAHPTHSVVAIGPRAEAYTARHHAAETPTGPLSPFFLHMQNGGAILCLGSDVGKVTSYHVVEDVSPDFPFETYAPGWFEKEVLFEDGSRRRVRTRILDPRLSPWRVDNFKPKEAEILDRLRQAGVVRIGTVGHAVSYLLDAAVLLETMCAWMRQGITIYHHPRWSTSRRHRK